MSDLNARSEGAAPDPTPTGEPNARTERQSAPDSPDSGNSGPSKLVTGGGLLGALGFIALIIAVRGGKLLARKAIEEPASPPPVVRTGPDPQAARALEHVFARQQTLKTIESLQRQYNLSQDEMIDVLKTVWLEENADSGQRPPWEPRAATPQTPTPPAALLGKKPDAQSARTATGPATKSDPDWWRYVDWDIEAIKDEMVARQTKKKNEAKAPKGK